MTAIQLLIDGTIRAAGLILRQNGIDKPSEMPYEDLERLTEAIKATLKANLKQILDEWEQATEAHLTEAWLRELMNAQANEMAIKALQSVGFI